VITARIRIAAEQQGQLDQSFADQYEAKHAIIYGRFRIGRITEVVEKFILW